MAQKQSSTNNQTTLNDKIQCTALNPEGNLGSFYDGYREGVLGQLSVRNEDRSHKSLKAIKCTLVKGKSDQYTNLLQLIDMPIELRISVLLGLAVKIGIASMMDYPHQINEYTRFLYYSYVQQEEQISDKIIKIQKTDKSSAVLSAATTHIIIGVKYGIDLVVILQLPPENDTDVKIHDVLNTICASLKSDQNPSVVLQENDDRLRRITITTVYSNIPVLMEISTLRDVCSYIDTNKTQTMNYPIMYTLRPIKWMFPQHTGPGANFASSPSAFCEKVEAYLLEFADTLERLKYSLDTEITPVLCGNLDKQLAGAQKELLSLKKTFTETVQRFHELIFEIRKNRSKIPSIDQKLTNIKTKTSKDIEKFNKLMEELNTKRKLITSLKNQEFIFCNAVNRHVTERDNDETMIRKLTINKNRFTRVFCTTDRLNKDDHKKCTDHRRLLAEERKAAVALFQDSRILIISLYCSLVTNKLCSLKV